MRYLIAFSAISVLVTQLANAEPQLTGSPSELADHLKMLNRIVSVQGEAELKAPADKAVLTLRVTSEAKALQEALRANQALRGKVVETLHERGVPRDRILPGTFSATPRHWIASDKARSYKVETFVKVAIKDEKEFQAAARVLDELPDVEYHDVDFEHAGKEELKRKVLTEALQNALARKKVYEQQLNLNLYLVRFTELPTIRMPEFPRQARAGHESGFAGIPPVSDGATAFNEMVFSTRVTLEYILEAK